MTPYVLLLCTGLVTLAAAESLQTACWKKDVSSWAWRYHEEMVNVLATGTATSMDVEIEHYELSESLSLCKKNETFGFTETKLWVSGGCRATFTVCYNQSYTFDAKINAMKNEFNDIQTKQQTEIERLEGIVKTLNATVTELVKDEAIDNQDTVQPVELHNGLTLQYDNVNDGGPWLIFQHRTSGDVDFNRRWASYTTGFGNTDNYWMGLDLVYSYCNVTNQCKLRVDVARSDVAKFATYETFYLEGPEEKFRIHLTGYSGTAGDSMMGTINGANGMKFSTADDDNDLHSTVNLVARIGAPWWWNKNSRASLNGLYGGRPGRGPFWYTFSGDQDALTSTAMKLRQIPQ